LQLQELEISFGPFMRFSRLLLALLLGAGSFFAVETRAGEREAPRPAESMMSLNDFEPPHFEFATESAYILSFIGNPNSYEIGAQFFTARFRWGVNRNDQSIFRGYNQVYLLAMAEPIFRGPENRYFGISAGFRHVFVRPGWRLQPYASGGVGAGFIDSTTTGKSISARSTSIFPMPGRPIRIPA